MTMTSMETTSGAPAPRRGWGLLLGYLLLLLSVPVGLMIGGEAASFAGIGMVYAPFVLLAALAYLGINRGAARVFAVIWALVLVLGMALAAFGLTASVGMTDFADPASFTPDMAALGGVALLALVSFVWLGLSFVPAVRRTVSRILPLEPTSFVHAVALATVGSITLLAFTPLIVTGVPVLLTPAFLDMMTEGSSEQSGLLSTVYTLVWSVPVSIFVVGFGLRRTFAETLSRLGVARPTWAQVGIGVATALVLVVVVNALELVLDPLWTALGVQRTDAEAFAQLIAFAFTPLGAVMVAVSAGIGEELAVRGVLQPRLGIVLSNLFFVSLHAWQYGWDALLVIFIVGAAMGILRKRTNTSVAAISHGVYNFTLIMMAIYGITLF
ncbi:CPBP family intramembrane metalloprotease [bacterium]|nr:CPBP family intramembrane metalloprotease [bacterium]